MSCFLQGQGLPGRIWETGEPGWIRNVQQDPEFQRSELCRQIDLRGAFGFPVKIGDELVAVLEFFAPGDDS